MKKIVITRPQEQGQIFASHLTESIEGLDSNNIILEPLLQIKQKQIHIENADKYDGIIVTSSNSIPALMKNDQILNRPFYCVGEQTAEKLKQAGVTDIRTGTYTVSDLTKKIPDNKNRFLYLRGKDINFDVKELLRKRSIIVDEKICYEALAANHFTSSFLDALIDNEIYLITFFSKRTAEVFVRLLQQWKNDNPENPVDVGQIHILCIAHPMIVCLHTVFDEEKIIVSKTPDMAGVIDAIDRYFSIS